MVECKINNKWIQKNVKMVWYNNGNNVQFYKSKGSTMSNENRVGVQNDELMMNHVFKDIEKEANGIYCCKEQIICSIKLYLND